MAMEMAKRAAEARCHCEADYCELTCDVCLPRRHEGLGCTKRLC